MSGMKSHKMSEGFSLGDMRNNDGFMFDCLEGRPEFEEMDDFSFSTDLLTMSKDKILSLLNMADFSKEEDITPDMRTAMPHGMDFTELKKRSTDISGDGKVLKCVKQQGIGEAIPPLSEVTVAYVAYLEFQDEPFDSTYKHGPESTFRLGIGTVLPGVEIALLSMRPYEIATFIIDPDYAYRDLGCPPLIPPKTEVLFAIRCIRFQDVSFIEKLSVLSPEEKKEFKNVKPLSIKIMNDGKINAGKRNYKQAVREYSRVVELLETARLNDDDEEAEMNKLLSRAYNNLAICHNFLDQPRRACCAFNNTPIKNVKSYFNHGRALRKMGEYRKALDQLFIAKSMTTNIKEIIAEIQLTSDKQAKDDEVEKNLWKRTFKFANQIETKNVYKDKVRNICEDFANDKDVVRKVLPPNLTPEELKCFREEIALAGLNFHKQEYNNEIKFYMTKKCY